MAISLFDIAGLVEPQAKFLQEKGIPVYFDPKRAAFVLAKMVDYAEYQKRKANHDFPFRPSLLFI